MSGPAADACSAAQRGRVFNNSDTTRILNGLSAMNMFEGISMRSHPNQQDPSKVHKPLCTLSGG